MDKKMLKLRARTNKQKENLLRKTQISLNKITPMKKLLLLMPQEFCTNQDYFKKSEIPLNQ